MATTQQGGPGNAPRGDKKPQRGGTKASGKQRGLRTDSPEVRLSKTVTWILRHGADQEGLQLRPDGYARVQELLDRPKVKDLTFEGLEDIVQKDAKGRFSLIQEPDPKSNSDEPVWWIRANQGHSMKAVKLDLQPVQNVSDIPTAVAVHGTNAVAWELIKTQGLRKMERNHIHLAQGVPGTGVISGMRVTATILIWIDVQKALDAGIKFFLSANGVVLTEGDDAGVLRPEFFLRVTDKKGTELTGWRADSPAAASTQQSLVAQVGESTVAVPEDGVAEVQAKTEALSL
ncbi:RNA 2'-phosphotransferase [Phanerochaete sordida]|uniref:2'-phosphotransferase n=1 Tax=Phanerochaete sordida TaxID=48140 RepID=A0A9P3GAZ8_9APHY|nr:RNA 2'-phosphotransferase [Phanerochaete sordida]